MTDLASRIEAMAEPTTDIFEEAWDATQTDYSDFGCFLAMLDAEAWTSAAEMLVPSGLAFTMQSYVDHCWSHIWHNRPGLDGGPFQGYAATPALALIAACVRAGAVKGETK